MSSRAWCDQYPHDCARVQKQQEREWLHTHDIAFEALDIVVLAAVVGLSIIAVF